MEVAVLMTCYNRAETTLRCLRSLFAQELPTGWALDVWLVDDASPDGTGAKVTVEFPQVHVIQSPGDLFWCKGMRLAWDTAAKAKDYDAYLWLNDDVVLDAGAVVGLQADVAEVGNDAILVGSLRNDKTGRATYGIEVDGRHVSPKGKALKTTGAMNGNFVYVPRSVFQKIGPIYGGYSHGYGDHDYGWQADRYGVSRYLCSKSVGTCPQEPERYRHRLKELSIWNRILVLLDRKGFSLRDTFIYKWRNGGLPCAVASAAHVVWVRVVLGKED